MYKKKHLGYETMAFIYNLTIVFLFCFLNQDGLLCLQTFKLQYV